MQSSVMTFLTGNICHLPTEAVWERWRREKGEDGANPVGPALPPSPFYRVGPAHRGIRALPEAHRWSEAQLRLEKGAPDSCSRLYPVSMFSWASLVAQLVKNPPAMQETWVQFLTWEDPPEKGKATHSSSGLENSMDSIIYGVAKSWTLLRDFHYMWCTIFPALLYLILVQLIELILQPTDGPWHMVQNSLT